MSPERCTRAGIGLQLPSLRISPVAESWQSQFLDHIPNHMLPNTKCIGGRKVRQGSSGRAILHQVPQGVQSSDMSSNHALAALTHLETGSGEVGN